MHQIRIVKSRCWRDGDRLHERVMGLLGVIRNHGLSLIVLLIVLIVPKGLESRRWRHGEWRDINAAANDAMFEMRRRG